MFIHFLCLCPLSPLRLAMLNFNISKVAYWPLAEQRLHSNDPRNFGSSFPCSPLSKVANDKFMTKFGYFETDKRV